MILKISVNKECKNKENPNVAHNWKNVLVDIDWLLGWVAAGYGWCATHFHKRHRNAQNAAGSNTVVIDFDGDCTLNSFWSTDTAKNWCIATYTSFSHSDKQHRFRAIFPLERELHSSAEHKGAYWLIVNRLLAELELTEFADNCGQKPERLWYGNTNTTVQRNSGTDVYVPQFLLEDITYQENFDFVPSTAADIDIRRCQWLLRNLLRPSEDGEYESYYVPVMAACAGIGGDVFDDWVNWVLRGHHGEKPENISSFKWRGLGNYSGHTTLYSLAKKQDPNWTKKLPQELWFRAAGTAAGYSEVDPDICFDDVISQNTQPMDNVIPLEPLPDMPVAKKRGRPKKSDDDAAKQREDDVIKVKEIFTDLRRNELTNQIEYLDTRDRRRTMQGDELDLLTTRLACENGVFIPEARAKAAVQYAANTNTFCPIRQYLDQCTSSALPHPDWDRIGEVFLGNKHYIATLAMQRMMIGAVARAYNPGCSMSWLPILVGAQGVGKSAFSRYLVPEHLFSEVTVPLETLNKEQYRLHVAWLLELPEIDNYFKPSNIENFKNLVTTRVDEVRRPYHTLPESLKRRFVMIGTTNRNQFLIDSTGNRRFVPLEIGPGFKIPWEQMNVERDSLWAAAVAAYRKGERHEFTTDEIKQMAEYIQEFGEPDPWMDKISQYLTIHSETTAADVLSHALELDPRQQGRRESRRVTDVLQALGWRKYVTRRKCPTTGKSKSVRLWQRPKSDPLPDNPIMNDF